MQDGKCVECTKKEHCSAGYKCEYNKCKEEEKCKAPTTFYKVSRMYYHGTLFDTCVAWW